MTKPRRFYIVLTEDKDEPDILNVTVPALPGCFTYGKGRRDAMKKAREAIKLFLESMDNSDDVVSLESKIAEVDV